MTNNSRVTRKTTPEAKTETRRRREVRRAKTSGLGW
jgi:hypothetical protein